MKLVAVIHGIEFDVVAGAVFAEEYNETLDSGSIAISHVDKIRGILPLDDVFIYDANREGLFYKHLLVDSYTEEMLTLTNPIKYTYKITLCSEAKKLEKIILPNISITQPLDKSERRSVMSYLRFAVNSFSPKIRIAANDSEWIYQNKYSLDESILVPAFANVDAPEMTLTAPNLREFISQLMMTKDCIPVVHDDVISCIDISKIRGTFDMTQEGKGHLSLFNGSMSSETYSTSARTIYSGAISNEGMAKMTEYLGFRSSDNGLLTLANMELETRFPIYKIDKVYMCYYKVVELLDLDNSTVTYKPYMVKQDITAFVVKNELRQTLSTNLTALNNLNVRDPDVESDDIAKFQPMTVGYSTGAKNISGWGNKFTKLKNSFWNTSNTKTAIEYIYDLMDFKHPYGIEGYASMKVPAGKIPTSIFRETSMESNNESEFFKHMLFKVEYTAMYNGMLSHKKNGLNTGDLCTMDNSSTGLTVLEADGIFKKSKMNRISSKTYSIIGRYGSYEEMNELGHDIGYAIRMSDIGDSYEPDADRNIIIYHREYSIYDDVVDANFAGMEDYVLKNYFTSVWARHRIYNLMSYGESITRADNKKNVIFISKDHYYKDSDTLLDGITSSLGEDTTHYIVASPFRLTTIPEKESDWSFPRLMNMAIFRYYTLTQQNTYAEAFSDVNAFTSGTSVCLNMRMYDNASGGVYIYYDRALTHSLDLTDILDIFTTTKGSMTGLTIPFESVSTNTPPLPDTPVNPFTNLIGTLNYKGSDQAWGIVYEDVTNPYSNSIGMFFGHYDSDAQFNRFAEKSTKAAVNSDISDMYIDKLNKLPMNILGNDESKTPVIDPWTYPIGKKFVGYRKDNKEIIDMTYQFEYESLDDDIFVTEWFAKLNDMIYGSQKLSQDVILVDSECHLSWYNGEDREVPGQYTMKISVLFPEGFMMTENDKISLSDGISNEYSRLFLYGEGEMTYTITELDGTSDSDAITAKGVANGHYYNGDGELVNLSNAQFSMKLWRKSYSSEEDAMTFELRTIENDDVTIPGHNVYDVFFGYENGYSEGNKYTISSKMDDIEGGACSEIFHSQNIFAMESPEEITEDLTKMSFSSLQEMSEHGINQCVPSFDDVFEIYGSLSATDRNRIIVNNWYPTLSDDLNSLQFWFLGDDGLYHFAFGINCVKGSSESDAINVYMSLMSNDSTHVWSSDHKEIVGEILNYADPKNDSELFGLYYEKKEDE